MANLPSSTLTQSLPAEESPSVDNDGAYMLPPAECDPAAIAGRLLELEEFAHLKGGEARIGWLLKRDEKIKGCRQVLGMVHLPKVQGDLNPCFVWMLERLFKQTLDYLVILDKAYWLGATPLLREILCYHELSHAIHKTDKYGDPMYDEEGHAVYALRGHSVEEFTSVVLRYGAWNAELEQFRDALNAHSEGTQI